MLHEVKDKSKKRQKKKKEKDARKEKEETRFMTYCIKTFDLLFNR